MKENELKTQKLSDDGIEKISGGACEPLKTLEKCPKCGSDKIEIFLDPTGKLLHCAVCHTPLE